MSGSWIHSAGILSYRAVRGNLAVGKNIRRCTPRLWNILSVASGASVGRRSSRSLDVLWCDASLLVELTLRVIYYSANVQSDRMAGGEASRSKEGVFPPFGRLSCSQGSLGGPIRRGSTLPIAWLLDSSCCNTLSSGGPLQSRRWENQPSLDAAPLEYFVCGMKLGGRGGRSSRPLDVLW